MTSELQVNLSEKVVALTGGGGVLCGAIARALGKRGAGVALLDVDEDAAAKVARDIRSEGGLAIAIECDVLDKNQLISAAARVEERLGPVDVLINGAGGNRAEATTSAQASFFDLPEDAVRSVFELNFLGAFLACQVFGKKMAEHRQGHIINISSMTAIRPLTRVPAYCAAKAALNSLTQWLAVHLNQNYSQDIRVNAIAPGFFLTEQNRYLLSDKDTGKLSPRGGAIISHTPMGRFGSPEDLVGTVLWLLSDSSSFVNGIVVAVDGGFSAFGGV